MKRKIYDCFLFNNELELLDIRINLLSPYVDYFVLIESPYSFPGEKKELIFNKNKHLFDTSKIIHGVFKNLPYTDDVNGINERGKANEYASRDYMKKVLDDVGADPEDIAMISDADEIPNMEEVIPELYKLEDENIHLLRNKRRPQLGTCMRLFYYYVNYLQSNRWGGTAICKVKRFRKPSKVRKMRGRNQIKNGGWHYSYLGGVDRIRTKIQRLGSIKMNKLEWTNPEHLEKCLNNAKDLYNRRKKLIVVDAEALGPKNIMKFVKKYPYLIKED